MSLDNCRCICWYQFYILIVSTGVQEVKPNVETKLVEVVCEDSVSEQSLLEPLQKWSASSGKSVELM